MPANVDVEKCSGCQNCVSVCPNEAIKMEDNLAVIAKEECIDCEMCKDQCASEAITME